MCRGFESLLRYQQSFHIRLCNWCLVPSMQEGRSREGAAFYRVGTSGLGQVRHAICISLRVRRRVSILGKGDVVIGHALQCARNAGVVELAIPMRGAGGEEGLCQSGGGQGHTQSTRRIQRDI